MTKTRCTFLPQQNGVRRLLKISVQKLITSYCSQECVRCLISNILLMNGSGGNCSFLDSTRLVKHVVHNIIFINIYSTTSRYKRERVEFQRFC